MSGPPLEGVRVLDLSRLLPGPFCTLILSELGARVDKVEDPHAGDYLRLFPPHLHGLSGRFAALNLDKRSLALDLKHPLGRETLLRLLPRYHVLVESFRPGVLARLGLPDEALFAACPRLSVCSISGYGQDGPYRDRAGHDLNYSALAGVLSLTGAGPGAPPHPLPIQLADLGGGGLWAAAGILAALYDAERSGRGRHLDVSMCEGSLSFLLPDLGNLAAGEPVPGRGAGLLTGGAACYGVYTTRDGRHLSVAALEPKFWLAFCAAIGRRGDAAEVVAGPAEQARIRTEVQAILGTRTRDEWEQVFAGADACVEPVLSPAEARQHPQHAARRVFSTYTDAQGREWPRIRTPLSAPPAEAPAPAPPPRLGEHGAAILADGGLGAEEIARLREAGAIR